MKYRENPAQMLSRLEIWRYGQSQPEIRVVVVLTFSLEKRIQVCCVVVLGVRHGWSNSSV
jgi:hypothetical protein